MIGRLAVWIDFLLLIVHLALIWFPYNIEIRISF